jgi:ABC-type lipoprotein export system ATPase subunit
VVTHDQKAAAYATRELFMDKGTLVGAESRGAA